MIKIVPILLMLPLLCFSTIGIGKPKKKQEPKKFPDVVFEIQETTNFYSKEEIEVVVDHNMLDLRNIYFKYLDKGLYFEGDILLKFTIAKNGKIINVDIMHSTTGNAEFDEAIKNKIAIWKWNVTKNYDNTSMVLFFFKFTAISRYSNYIINSGSRSGGEIVQILTAKMPRLRRIYMKEYLKLKSDLSGKIILRFTIAGSGEVTNVDIIASTTEYAEFDETIKNEVATWKWKLIKEGNTSVTTIFNF